MFRDLAPMRLHGLERYAEPDRARILDAIAFARRAHEGHRRIAGPPYVTHLFAVAQVLIDEFGADADTVITALLHDTVEDTPVTLDEIERAFGPAIRFLVDGCTDVGEGDGAEKISLSDERRARTREKIREYGARDARVYLVKIADRWHNLLTSSRLRAKSQRRMAEDALLLHVPACRELGFHAQADAVERAAKEMLARIDCTS